MANILSDKSNQSASAKTKYLTVKADFKPSINLDYLRKTAIGDSKFMERICKIFHEKTPMLITYLQESIINGDTDKTTVLAHRIKTHFETIGITQLSESLEQLETQSSKQKTMMARQRLSKYINNLEESWQYAIDQLHEEGFCKQLQ